MPAPWSVTDLRSAITEVYGTRYADGTVQEPLMSPVALERAFTAWVEANPNQQFSQAGADKYQELARQIGPITVEELQLRYPLAVQWLERRDRANIAAEADAWDRYNYGQETGHVPGPDIAKIEAAAGPVPQATTEQKQVAATGRAVYGGPGGPGGNYTPVVVYNEPPAPKAPMVVAWGPPPAIEGGAPLQIHPYIVPTPVRFPQAIEQTTIRAEVDTELRMLLEGVHPEQPELEELAQELRPLVPRFGYQPLLDYLVYFVTSIPTGIS